MASCFARLTRSVLPRRRRSGCQRPRRPGTSRRASLARATTSSRGRARGRLAPASAPITVAALRLRRRPAGPLRARRWRAPSGSRGSSAFPSSRAARRAPARAGGATRRDRRQRARSRRADTRACASPGFSLRLARQPDRLVLVLAGAAPISPAASSTMPSSTRPITCPRLSPISARVGERFLELGARLVEMARLALDDGQVVQRADQAALVADLPGDGERLLVVGRGLAQPVLLEQHHADVAERDRRPVAIADLAPERERALVRRAGPRRAVPGP